uniref:NADH:ubiquinone reductase (H(+)-translocating) n=1 Tax=Eutima sp. BMK-2020 TaxID=2790655 RepID=A0A7S9DFN1_9CNID|nr:NADH dehydrogenase subunit 2 [Eutima sp. BMK-2020]
MNFSILNIIIICIIIITIVEYKKNKSNINYLFISLFIILLIINSYWIFDTNFFSIQPWKYGFLLMIFGLFLTILELIEKNNLEIYCLVCLVFIGSILLVISSNLITLYLGLELQTFCIFILIAKNRLSVKGSEAGLKYFILGAISSGFYLLGITMLFLIGSSLEIVDLKIISNDLIFNISLIFITLSLCFKLTLFPLHFWIPDVYEGSSWEIISLISTLPKISVICILIQMLINSDLIIIFSLLSIIIGTLGSFNQSKTKRLFGYSGISHMGFIMLSYGVFINTGFIVGNLYLVIYMIGMISIFSLIINFFTKSKYIIELSHLKFSSRCVSISWVLLILSIAGIPPLSGFISKWFLLWNTINFDFAISSFIIILFSAIGAGYYLRLVKMVYFQKKSSFFLWESILTKELVKNELSLLVLGIYLFFSFFLILNFSFFIDILNFNLN